MTGRVVYVLCALLLGVGALVGVRYSDATFTDQSNSPAQVVAARDWTAPVVAVDDPGSVVDQVVTVTATAHDETTTVAAVAIQFRPQGSAHWQLLCVDDDGDPWDCTWDTVTVDDGSYELRAVATDEEGNEETSAIVSTEVSNTAGVVLDPVPTPVRGTIRLSAHMVDGGPTTSNITFQVTPTGTSSWSDLPGCTSLTGPAASCDFDTTSRVSGTTHDLRAVGRRGSTDYYDVETGILVDNTSPSVTIDQAALQADPTSGSTINFAVVFSEPVTGFEADDVTLGGTTSGARTTAVTGGGTTYNVAVTGMTGDGTVTAAVPSGGVVDEAGNGNAASTSSDNTVTRDVTAPTVTVTRADGQSATTSDSSINFKVTFDEPVTGFTSGDLKLSGTSGGTQVQTVTGGPTVFNVAVTGMVRDGDVVAAVSAGVATDLASNPNTASATGGAGQSVTYDDPSPTVTINQAAGQADPTNGSTISFTVQFSEVVTGFAAQDVIIGGTATGTKTVTVTGTGATYHVAVTGMTSSGTVVATVGERAADDAASQPSIASTSVDNTVTRDVTAPVATIDRAAGQANLAFGSEVNFSVVFNEVVTGFDRTDVTVSGTAGGTKTVTVTGTGTTYNVRVTGMTATGTVVVNVAAGCATDAAGNGNATSVIVDNSVLWTL